MKAYQHPCRCSTQQTLLRVEQDPIVCEWGSSWDQLLQEHMCLAKIHFYKMRSPLCQNCPEWCWNICGVPQGFVIGTLRLRTSIAFTLYTSFFLGVLAFFLSFFFVSKITLLGGAYRWYPKASFVCTIHYIFISGSFPIAATLAFVFSPKISLVFPF